MSLKSAETPWCDCKVAFPVETDEGVFEEFCDDSSPIQSVPINLPKGWSLDEVDCAGARCVAVFRVEGDLRREDGEAVALRLKEFDRKARRRWSRRQAAERRLLAATEARMKAQQPANGESVR